MCLALWAVMGSPKVPRGAGEERMGRGSAQGEGPVGGHGCGSGVWELQVGAGSGRVGRHLTVPAIHQLQGLHIMKGDTLLQQRTA